MHKSQPYKRISAFIDFLLKFISVYKSIFLVLIFFFSSAKICVCSNSYLCEGQVTMEFALKIRQAVLLILGRKLLEVKLDKIFKRPPFWYYQIPKFWWAVSDNFFCGLPLLTLHAVCGPIAAPAKKRIYF